MKESSISETPGLYIHIPFCKSKCNYCDFYSTSSFHKIPAFIKSLLVEMELYRKHFDRFDTIYMGGGTPSVLGTDQLAKVVSGIHKYFTILPDYEFTIEINPADFNLDSFTAAGKYGINRVNIGIQSFDDDILSFLGRRHTSAEAVSAIETARKAGFNNIGIDLIYGIPGQDIDAWLATLKKALLLHPEHISCYQLTIEPDTPFGRRYNKRAFSLPTETAGYDFFMKTAELLEHAGYLHYEVSNYSKDLAFASRHNQKYWNHTFYLGLGPSAHSFKNNNRWQNYGSIEKYMDALDFRNLPIEEMESLTLEQLQFETFYLCLRTKKGINLSDFTKKYRYDLLSKKQDILSKLIEGGLVEIRDKYLSPTRRGLAIADSLALI